MLVLELGNLNHEDFLVLCLFQLFHKAATTLLYQDFYGSNQNLPAFLVTILKSKSHAASVRRVNFRNLSAQRRKRRPSTSQLNLFIAHVDFLHQSLSVRNYWISHLRRGHGEALGALALAYLPNVRKLEIWADNDSEYREKILPRFRIEGKPFWTLTLLENLSFGPIQKRPSFESLREITVLSSPSSVYDFATIFGLPSIRTVRIWDLFEPAEYEDFLSPHSSNVDDLALTTANISAECLIRMIHSCKALRRFTFDRPIDLRVPQSYPRVIDALALHRNSLEILCLRDQDPRCLEANYIDSLTQFDRLRKFVGDASIFYGTSPFGPLSEIFPRGIEKIELRNVRPDVLHTFDDASALLRDITLVRDSTRCFPNLLKVNIVHGLHSIDPDVNAVSGEFLEDGVALKILDRFYNTYAESIHDDPFYDEDDDEIGYDWDARIFCI